MVNSSCSYQPRAIERDSMKPTNAASVGVGEDSLPMEYQC